MQGFEFKMRDVEGDGGCPVQPDPGLLRGRVPRGRRAALSPPGGIRPA